MKKIKQNVTVKSNAFGLSKKSQEAWKKGGKDWQKYMSTIK